MLRLPEEERQRLTNLATDIRALCVSFITKAGWGHIGGSFSEAELMAALYGSILRVDPENPGSEQRDRFLLSKAHASPGYAALALTGHLEKENCTNTVAWAVLTATPNGAPPPPSSTAADPWARACPTRLAWPTPCAKKKTTIPAWFAWPVTAS